MGSAAQFLCFGFKLSQLGIDAHLAIELFFFGQLGLRFLNVALQSVELTQSQHQISQLFLGTRGQRYQRAQQIFVQSGHVQHHRQGLALRIGYLPGTGKVVTAHPLAGIGIAWAFVASHHLGAALMVQLKHDGELHRAVNAAQHVMVQLRRFEVDAEHLHLGHTGSGGQVDGFRGQFVLPDDLIYLAYKEVFEPGIGSAFFVELVFGQWAAKRRLGRVAEQGFAGGLAHQGA